MSAERRCQECGAPVAADQRYCLTCGARVGDPSPQLDALLASIAATPAEPAATPAAAPQPAGGGPRLPGPWVSALLVLLFVGFGALLGDAGAHRYAESATRALKVVAPKQESAGSGGTTSTPGGESTGAETSPPESEPEATPAPAATSSPAPQAASSGSGKQPASSSEGETSGGGGGGGGGSSKAATAKLTDVKHVFVIVLSDEPYASDFGPESPDHYLSGALEHKGELLLRYDAVAHEQLADAVALVSGQGPTTATAANCPAYVPITPGTPGGDEQVGGEGCVYPQAVQTLPGQLQAKHLGWRAYVQGMDEGGAPGTGCQHPGPGEAEPAGSTYAAFRNPFVYFASLTGTPACAADDVGLSRLAGDLKGAASQAPAFSYIVPDRCHDGNPTPCSAGAPAGPADAAPFLEQVVPEILASSAYKHGGLLVITADEAPSSGELADSSSCCGQPSAYPNLAPPAPGSGHGGGTVGALLLSPLIKGGTINQEEYDHFSLLRTVEDVFRLKHLGYAALPGVKSFSPALLNRGG